MSRFRNLLNKPHSYLAILLILVVVFAIDSSRHPQNQVSVVIYVGLVRGYQQFGRPLTRNLTTCPFRPTCSRYSLEAVERHGIRRGLWLTASRLFRCNGTVELGTRDPVPQL